MKRDFADFWNLLWEAGLGLCAAFALLNAFAPAQDLPWKPLDLSHPIGQATAAKGADFERARAVANRNFFRRAATFRIVDGQHQLIFRQVELHCTAALAGNRRYAIDGLLKCRVRHLHFLVVVVRNPLQLLSGWRFALWS